MSGETTLSSEMDLAEFMDHDSFEDFGSVGFIPFTNCIYSTYDLVVFDSTAYSEEG